MKKGISFFRQFSFFGKAPHHPKFGGLEILKYIGPGLLVTVGFIDPGNWASNIAAGADYGYTLLWMVTLSTVMLIILQHNVAHLGIVTGLCLSEATTTYLRKPLAYSILSTAMLSSVFTSLAEILGAAIALNMLFGLPVKIGALLSAMLVLVLLFTNSYRKIERWIIGFVSLIGVSFIYELSLVQVEWGEALHGWVVPDIPDGSILIIMSVLGAVVMPHNLFLHSEVIQSRQWNLQDPKVIKKQLRYEFFDTLFSMVIGFCINSAMIILAAATFFQDHTPVIELQQAQTMLRPLLGTNAAVVFAVALLFAGIASSVTSGMAGGSIFSGIFSESYDIKDRHSKTGVLLSIVVAALLILFISNPFQGLLLSQMALSIQLPVTVITQIYLTSSKKVMGVYANRKFSIALLALIAVVICYLNIRLFLSVL